MTSPRQIDDEKTTSPLPYIPPHVKLEKPFPDTDEKTLASIEEKINHPSGEVLDYINNRLEGNKYGRYSKKLFGTSHGIINGKMSLYAVYNTENKQSEISEPGKLGKIKLVKNLNTNEWLVLKTQLLEIPSKKESVIKMLTNIYQNEHDILSTLALSNEPLMTRRSIKNNKLLKGYLIMKYAKGGDLLTFANKKLPEKSSVFKWPDVFSIFSCKGGEASIDVNAAWRDLFGLHLCIRLTEALIQEVACHNMLHCDVKFENFMYDMPNDTVHVIDFGNAKKKTGYSVQPLNKSLAGFNAPENFISGYSEKSEVYALSNIFETFLLNNVPTTYSEKEVYVRYFTESRFKSCGPSLFTNDKEIVAFVTNMRNHSENARPTLQETLEFLKISYDRYKENKKFTKDFCLVDQILQHAKVTETLRLETAHNKLSMKK